MHRAFRRINAEIDQAVTKIGPVTMPDGSHVDNWYDKVSDSRDKLATRT